MRHYVRAGLVAVLSLSSVGALATRCYSGGVVASDWDVSGLHNTEGAYTGKAHLELDQLAVKLTITATTATGKTLSWSGRGKLDAGAITLTMDAGPTIPGA